MALKATIFKAELQVADLDRSHFGDYTLTIARHPSETDERMMVRLLAFAMFAGQDLSFGKGVSSDEEAAVWEIDPAGVIKLWVEVGLPDETRIRKACNRSEQVVVLAYGARSVDIWWKQNADNLKRFENLEVLQLKAEESQALAMLAAKKMAFSCTLQEGTIYFEGVELHPLCLQFRQRT
ncbi:MAG: hypothetical protein RIR18_1351 [Pseudomonadota bacterium]|jgi:uncharacterized protein YaeQ